MQTRQSHSQTFAWVNSFGRKGDFLCEAHPAHEARGPGSMLFKEFFLKMNAQKAKFGNFSVTK